MNRDLSDVELLGMLVGFSSTSDTSNRGIAEFIADYLEAAGLRVELLPYGDGHHCNLLAMAGPEITPDRRGLVLSGHMDVVPAVEEGWLSDPFQLSAKDGRLYGRGTADMKGFLAVAMTAAAAATSLTAPLVVLFTAEEEVGCLGARAFVEAPQGGRLLPRAAVVGEPTDLRVVRMHKGHLRLRLATRGRSSHSGYPHLGDNAIEKAGIALGRLSELRREFEIETNSHGPEFDEVPYPAMNLAMIRGGTAINIVPDGCEIEIGVRLLPDMDARGYVMRIEEALAEVLRAEEWDLEVMSESPPMVVDAESVPCSTLLDICGQSAAGAVNFATDAGWFQRLDLECVLFGPGDIENAHRPNEFVLEDDLVRARSAIDSAVGRLCGGGVS